MNSQDKWRLDTDAYERGMTEANYTFGRHPNIPESQLPEIAAAKAQALGISSDEQSQFLEGFIDLFHDCR